MSEHCWQQDGAGKVLAAETAKHPCMGQVLLCTHPRVQHFGAAGKARVSSRLMSGRSPGHELLHFLERKTSKLKRQNHRIIQVGKAL